MRSAPSLCSAATAHYAPASTLFSSPTPPSTQTQRSAHTPLSFLKPARFPQASVHFVLPLPFTLLSSSNSTLDANLTLSSDARAFLEPALFSQPRACCALRSSFHIALFPQHHARLQPNAQLRRPFFPQARACCALRSSVFIALFLQLHTRLKLSAQLRRPLFPQACSLFSPPRSVRSALFLSPCSLPPTPPSTPT